MALCFTRAHQRYGVHTLRGRREQDRDHTSTAREQAARGASPLPGGGFAPSTSPHTHSQPLESHDSQTWQGQGEGLRPSPLTHTPTHSSVCVTHTVCVHTSTNNNPHAQHCCRVNCIRCGTHRQDTVRQPTRHSSLLRHQHVCFAGGVCASCVRQCALPYNPATHTHNTQTCHWSLQRCFSCSRRINSVMQNRCASAAAVAAVGDSGGGNRRMTPRQ
jgi:hypothetical protein